MSSKNKISFEKMSHAITTILNDVNKIRDLLEKNREFIKNRTPIQIDEAYFFLMSNIEELQLIIHKLFNIATKVAFSNYQVNFDVII